MFAHVRLIKGFQKILTYKIPDDWTHTRELVGKIVRVPIRNQEAAALVVAQYKTLTKKPDFEIREIINIESFPEDTHYELFIKKLCDYYCVNTLHFLQRIHTFLGQESKPQTLITQKKNAQDGATLACNVILTHEQQQVFDFLKEKIARNLYAPTVLHGVTGSGKTEVYKKLIIEAITNKKSALLLLPEVTLAIKFETIMRTQLPSNIPICTFHSGTNVKEKRQAWNQLIAGTPLLIIGVHIPTLLPIANLGVIIVDEEHESGYQEKKHPKINSKDAAIMRAHTLGIPILLGSATPSITSLYNVKTKGWNFFQLKKRFTGNFPIIKTVHLGDKDKTHYRIKSRIRQGFSTCKSPHTSAETKGIEAKASFWISEELELAIKERLDKREQVIIFLNRRGFSFFVQCKDCSFIFCCPNCSVSLTLHKGDILTCHYCDYAITQPDRCPSCKKDAFLKKGIGTQQVVTILEKMFPYARIGRADLDTSAKKNLWKQTLEDFEAGGIDILVGTQTISKGFHFPRVTLVGILWADLNLHFPIFNATETTLQQLIQVAGRAGRNHECSEVIVQTMTDHPVFEYINEINYIQFYKNEIEKRQFLGYPPYKRLVEIELKHTDEQIIEREAAILAVELTGACKKYNLQIDVLGPAQPPVSKIKNTFIRKIYLKGTNSTLIAKLFKSIDATRFASRIFFTPNPLN